MDPREVSLFSYDGCCLLGCTLGCSGILYIKAYLYYIFTFYVAGTGRSRGVAGMREQAG
jgi:hypothetical protein